MRPDAAADEFKALVADEDDRDAYRSTAPCDSFELGPQTEDGRPPCAHRKIAPSPPPALAALRSVELPLGRPATLQTTPDDVHPGHCVRLAVDVDVLEVGQGLPNARAVDFDEDVTRPGSVERGVVIFRERRPLLRSGWQGHHRVDWEVHRRQRPGIKVLKY